MTDTVETARLSRRSFLRKGAIGGSAAAAATLAAPAVLAQAPILMKMQTSWPASDIWQEFAQDYATRVEEMSAGRLKVDLLPAGAVVGAFQVMDAVNDGVLDAAHSVSAYWYGKNKAASLFGTGPVFGASSPAMLAWFYQGGGQELYNELTRDMMGLNVVRVPRFPDVRPALRLVQGAGEQCSRHPGLQVPHGRTCRRPVPVHGHVGRAASGWRDRPRDGARRDRRVRVQQPHFGQPLRRAGRGQELLPVLLPPGCRTVRIPVQRRLLRRPVVPTCRRS